MRVEVSNIYRSVLCITVDDGRESAAAAINTHLPLCSNKAIRVSDQGGACGLGQARRQPA